MGDKLILCGNNRLKLRIFFQQKQNKNEIFVFNISIIHQFNWFANGK